MIDRATPQPSSDSSSDSDASSDMSNAHKKTDFKSSLSHLHEEFKKSFVVNRLSTDRRKSTSEDKKMKNLSKVYLTAPNSNQNQIKKSPSTPMDMSNKTHH
ncbi:unnamed protein product [Adineta ricciae]|nr:unnamed protein product [Adineta ricciae]